MKCLPNKFIQVLGAGNLDSYKYSKLPKGNYRNTYTYTIDVNFLKKCRDIEPSPVTDLNLLNKLIKNSWMQIYMNSVDELGNPVQTSLDYFPDGKSATDISKANLVSACYSKNGDKTFLNVILDTPSPVDIRKELNAPISKPIQSIPLFILS